VKRSPPLTMAWLYGPAGAGAFALVIAFLFMVLLMRVSG
jgi:hypothetical protein